MPGAEGIAIITSSGSASLDDPLQLVGRAQHAHAVDPHVAHRRVVVGETDRGRAELRVADDLAKQQAAAVARADDQHAARSLQRPDAVERPLVDHARGEAGATDQHEHQQEEADDDAGRDRERDLPAVATSS